MEEISLSIYLGKRILAGSLSFCMCIPKNIKILMDGWSICCYNKLTLGIIPLGEFNMNGNKVWYKSLGIVGPLLGGVALLINGFFGAEIITQVDITGLTTNVTALADAAFALWTVFSAVVGRARATKTVTLTKSNGE